MKHMKLALYFILNTLGIHKLPRLINFCKEEWWFSVLYEDIDGTRITYSRYVDMTEMENLFVVSDKSAYKAHLKMMRELWRERKNIFFGND